MSCHRESVNCLVFLNVSGYVGAKKLPVHMNQIGKGLINGGEMCALKIFGLCTQN